MIHELSIVDARHSSMRAGGAHSAGRRQAHARVTDAIGAEMERPHILIVDDDECVRTALEELMLSLGYDATCFASPRELLDADLPQRPGCLILDVRMPGSSGLDLQNRLAARDDTPPIIFLTGHGDIPMSVAAMKAGAVDFLTKPVRDQTLLDAVSAGIERDIARRRQALLVKEHVDGVENRRLLLWSLLNFEHWCRTFLGDADAPEPANALRSAGWTAAT